MQHIWLADLKRANGDGRRLIEDAFLRAILTCDTLPDREWRYFHVATAWPLSPRDAWFGYEAVDLEDHAVPFTPSPADLDRMLIALAWGRGLDRAQWKIAHLVADGYSDAAIGDRLRLPPAEVADRYQAAISEVCRAARAPEAA